MWGSDLSRLRGTYRECVTMFAEEMKWLSGNDIEPHSLRVASLVQISELT